MKHRLSKSRFQTGLQCEKALWLACNARELADPVSSQQQHIFDTGTRVGELAQERFPGGVLVAEDHTQSAQALLRTRDLLETGPPAAIFEAALRHEGVFVRPDVLVHVADDVWDLHEVKSSTKVKPEHVTDVAVQTWVLEGAGLRIRRAYLMHLNSGYVYEGGEYDLEQLFSAADVTEQAREFIPHVGPLVASMLAMVDGPMPEVRIGKRCASPYTCAYHGHCHAFLPQRPVTALPRISSELLNELLDSGIHAIDDIPDRFPGLSAAQRDVCAVVRSGEARYVGDLAASLSPLEAPVYFLDFETVQSALPLWPGTRPWQQVPFQWSVHVLDEQGALRHLEYVHTGVDDPRPELTRQLIEALGDRGSIVVYSSFENTQLGGLASAFPMHARSIADIQRRLYDLLVPVRKHVRHPECLGSSSIKAVLPALVPDLSYEGMPIADGNTASIRYLQYVTGSAPEQEAEQLFADLRAYCGLDTLAMVRLLEVLNDAATEQGVRRPA